MFRPTNIMPPDDIFKSCTEIQSFTEAHYNADNQQAVTDRATYLESYMALSGKMLADAKFHCNELLNSVFIEAIKTGNKERMATSTLNKYIDSLCRDYSYLVDWCDRLNRTCTHQIEMSRTMLSKLKTEMIMANR